MGFTVRLSTDDLTVEPGTSMPVAVEIKNEGAEKEEFEISLEGLDYEWTAIPVPTVKIDSEEQVVERFFVKPARDSNSAAGTYPFVVKVRSLDSGESKTIQCSLTIQSFHHLSIDLNPRKSAVTPLNKITAFEATVMNLGNTEQSLQIFVSDVDDAMAYEIEEESLTLAPGQQKTVNINATATKLPMFSGSSLAAVTVSARNISNPAVAISTQAQVELRPIIAPGPLLALAAILVVFIGWLITIPKPPRVDSFTASPQEVVLGEAIELSWQTSEAGSVSLSSNGETTEQLPPDGETTITPDKVGRLIFTLRAVSGDRASDPREIVIEVKEPPVVPLPKIERFAPEKATVPLGSSVTLEYDVNDATTYAYIEPFGQVDPKAKKIQVMSPPDDIQGAGRKVVKYTLIARNASGQEVQSTINVTFVKESKATIVRFAADPTEVDPLDSRVTVSWQATNAVRIVLKSEAGEEEITALNDRREFAVTKDTSFTLTVYDADGLSVSKTIAVKLKQPPVEPEEDGPTVEPPTGDGAGTTGGAAADPPSRTITNDGGTRR